MTAPLLSILCLSERLDKLYTSSSLIVSGETASPFLYTDDQTKQSSMSGKGYDRLLQIRDGSIQLLMAMKLFYSTGKEIST